MSGRREVFHRSAPRVFAALLIWERLEPTSLLDGKIKDSKVSLSSPFYEGSGTLWQGLLILGAWGSGWGKHTKNRTPLFLLLLAQLHCLGEGVNSDTLLYSEVDPSLMSLLRRGLFPHPREHQHPSPCQLVSGCCCPPPVWLLLYRCSGARAAALRTTRISVLKRLFSPKPHCHKKLRGALLQALPLPPSTFPYPLAASDPPVSSHYLLQHPAGPQEPAMPP